MAAALSLQFTACKKKEPVTPEPPQVLVVKVEPQDIPIFREWIGTLDGYVNAQIRAQVSGYLVSQEYAEGDQVKKGDLLFRIDPRPFEAALEQARAKLAQDRAQLGKTELDVKRYTPLAREDAISQQELDDAVQANLAAQAAMKADQALVDVAQLNLGFTHIVSPINGLPSIAQVQIGDLVGPTGPLLTTVSTIDPIKVYFTVSEQAYLDYRRRYSDPAARAAHEQGLELELILADGSTYPSKGRFISADREVNVTTGTLLLMGLFPNTNFTLRPGQFARVRARTETRKNALMVPQRAVSEMQGTHQVALVDGQGKVHVQAVKVGERVGSNWVIEQGLTPGALVVVEGTQKAKEGVVVQAQAYAADVAGRPGETNRLSATNESRSEASGAPPR